MTLTYWRVSPDAIIRVMSSGRTKPLLCQCTGCRTAVHDEFLPEVVETGQLQDEFVVKFAGTGEMTPRGCLCEWIGALLAQCLLVPAAEPAIVEIPPDVAAILPNGHRQVIAQGNHSHFGSRFLGQGWSTYPQGKVLGKALLDSALSIFVFDMLTQNIDRRTDKPNVLTDGEILKAYDHELAFSFLMPVLGDKPEPWQVQHQEWAYKHVFYSLLRGRTLDVDTHIQRLGNLNGGIMKQIRRTVPNEWASKDVDEIFSHIQGVQDAIGRFADEINRVLAP